jgi:hypothetical protein
LNIAEKDLADLAFSGLLTHIKDKLEGQQCSDLNQVCRRLWHRRTELKMLNNSADDEG